MPDRRSLLLVLVPVVVLTTGVLAGYGLWADPAGRVIAANLPDATHYSWWLGHTPHALGEGRSPLFTRDLNTPIGVSAMNNTTLLLPAVLLWPVTAAFGALTTLNLLNVLAVPACALAMYWALRRGPLALAVGPALVGAAGYAVSPAVIHSLAGHITMAFAPALPLLVMLSVRAWLPEPDGGRSPVRTGVGLGLLAAAQVVIGEEVLFQAGMGALIVLVVAAVSRPGLVVAGARRLGVALAVAFAVFLPLAAYPLHQQFFGRLRQHGSPFLPDYYGTDLLSFLVPTDQQLLHTRDSSAVAARFPGGIEEHLGYVGAPLLLLALLALVLLPRSLPVRCAVAGLAVAAVLSLGGRIWVNGTWTQARGPYSLLQSLPVTEASLATRFGMLIALFGATVLALVGQALASRGRVVTAALVAAACLAPLVPRPLDVVPAPAVPAYFSTEARSLPAGSVLMVLPYPVAAQPVAMLWQAAADYRFRMPGGYFLGPAADGTAYVGGDADPATARLLSQVASSGVPAPVTPARVAQARRDLTALGVSAVVLGPDRAAGALARTVTGLLGAPPQVRGGVQIWAVR